MGTRNVTVVKIKGEYRIAQYGQWDGYPTGQGRTIVEFLRSMDRDNFVNKCLTTRFLTDDEIKAIPDNDWEQSYPQLHRDVAGKILKLVNDAPEGLVLHNELAFAGNSLMCEWVYVVDFDINTFEVYKGFNYTPLTEADRFFNLEPYKAHDGTVYHPVKLVKSFALDSLPTDNDLVALCEE